MCRLCRRDGNTFSHSHSKYRVNYRRSAPRDGIILETTHIRLLSVFAASETAVFCSYVETVKDKNSMLLFCKLSSCKSG